MTFLSGLKNCLPLRKPVEDGAFQLDIPPEFDVNVSVFDILTVAYASNEKPIYTHIFENTSFTGDALIYLQAFKHCFTVKPGQGLFLADGTKAEHSPDGNNKSINYFFPISHLLMALNHYCQTEG